MCMVAFYENNNKNNMHPTDESGTYLWGFRPLCGIYMAQANAFRVLSPRLATDSTDEVVVEGVPVNRPLEKVVNIAPPRPTRLRKLVQLASADKSDTREQLSK